MRLRPTPGSRQRTVAGPRVPHMLTPYGAGDSGRRRAAGRPGRAAFAPSRGGSLVGAIEHSAGAV